eukprot:166586_1
MSSSRERAVSLFDEYFTQEDTYDATSSDSLKEMTLLSSSDLDTPRSVDYRWQWRHTVSYWISVGFVLGGMLFVVGALSDVFVDKLHDIDYHTLNPIGFLFGAIAYVFGGYCGYYQVINESTKYNPSAKGFFKRKKAWCIHSGKKTIPYWAAFSYLVANTTTFIQKIPRALQIEFVKYSLPWFLIMRFTMIIVYIGLFMGGALQLYLNKGWKWRPYKLGWIASWCDALAGALFLFQGSVNIWFVDENNKMLQFWMLDLWCLIACIFYLISGVLYLLMWKLQQFGLTNLPQLNRIKHRDTKKLDSVLHRDVLFIFLYCVTLVTALFAMVYSIHCGEYRDWIKNFFLHVCMSIALLVVSSFLHKEPDKPPLTYLLWFVRIYMIGITINLFVDISHLRNCLV